MDNITEFTFNCKEAAMAVSHMNRLQRGAYFDVLIAQTKFYLISENDLHRILGKDYNKVFDAIKSTLVFENGMYYIPWLRSALDKRAKFIKSQSDRINKRWGKDDTAVCEIGYRGIKNDDTVVSKNVYHGIKKSDTTVSKKVYHGIDKSYTAVLPVIINNNHNSIWEQITQTDNLLTLTSKKILMLAEKAQKVAGENFPPADTIEYFELIIQDPEKYFDQITEFKHRITQNMAVIKDGCKKSIAEMEANGRDAGEINSVKSRLSMNEGLFSELMGIISSNQVYTKLVLRGGKPAKK